MCLRTTSFFLYRLYLWADKGSLFPGNICLFKYQKPFSEASPDHFPRISFIRTESQSAPGCGDGAISLIPTKQNLPLELEEGQKSFPRVTKSWEREMGKWWINQQCLQGVLVDPALDVPIFWPSALCHHCSGKSGICSHVSPPYGYDQWESTGKLQHLSQTKDLQLLSPGSPFHTWPWILGC